MEPSTSAQRAASQPRDAAAPGGAVSRRERKGHGLLALLFYAVATLGIAWPLPPHALDTVARAIRPDTWLNLWALAWTAEHLLSAPLSLFEANIFYPHAHTLAYSDHFIGEALLALPVYALSDNAVLAYNVAWYAALVLTGWGGYLWLRGALGNEPGAEAAALVGGAVCLLVPGKRTALSHLQVISLQGVTLSLAAMHALLRRPTAGRAAMLAAAALYAALCSWYTAAYSALLLPAVGLAGVLWVAGDGRRDGGSGGAVRRRAASGAAALSWGGAALAATALLMVPVVIPYRAVQRELDVARPLGELAATALRPVDYVASWSWLHEGWMPAGSGAGGYFPGFIASALGLFGLWRARRRGDRWPLLYGAAAAVFALLALGPWLSLGSRLRLPLPYLLLYRFVPGFGALRNPYRAAFIATLLFAMPVAYGARELIVGLRAAFLRGQRWKAHPRLAAVAPLSWALALALASAHLIEAWPGPQEVASLPRAPSAAYEWLAGQGGASTLVWPLPRPFDDNARYQLWSTGGWAPLVNGHSGVYPADFLRLYEAGAEFPEAAFLAVAKELFPIDFVLAHYGLTGDDGSRRRLAAAAAGLEEVWSEGDDVVYRIRNGAPAGWMRRRFPSARLGEHLDITLSEGAVGCTVRVAMDGAAVGEARIPAPAPGAAGPPETWRARVDLPAAASRPFTRLEVWLVDASGVPRLDLTADGAAATATLELDGWRLAAAPFVALRLEAAGGRIAEITTADADESSAAALRELLAAAATGDTLAVAIAEGDDATMAERLRLLLDAAGGRAVVDASRDAGGAYAFVGTVGAAPGSALEAIGAGSVRLSNAPSPAAGEATRDCRVSPIIDFTWKDTGR